jgi:60 kDa SS-A/Ro ribonucleoprotein
MTYLQGHGTRSTPQNEPIPGSAQVPNSAGGFSFEVDVWMQVRRFLILGSEGGSYYVGERQLTAQNVASVRQAVALDGRRLVDEVIAISEGGRAPKNDPALLALAIAAAAKDADVRRYALDSLPRVARTGTHLFTFLSFVNGERGEGRGLRRAVANWYTLKDRDSLAMQLVKYRSRGGWTHRDALRVGHPKPSDAPETADLLRWAAGKDVDLGPDLGRAPGTVRGFYALQEARDAKDSARIISEYGGAVTWEMVQSEHLTSPAVWEALLPTLPLTALVRNLANMTRIGLVSPMSAAAGMVTERLSNAEAIHKARLHPISLLAAQVTYAQGHGMRGQNTWTPVSQVIDALDEAFYFAFDNVEPTNKRYMLALDVSSSMDYGQVSGVPGLSPRVASAAMALVTARTEANYTMMAFQTQFVPLSLSPRSRLDDAIRTVSNLNFGGTDCAQPMLYASRVGMPVDVFIVYTDSETWAGSIHPPQALKRYREQMGIDAKLIVVGMEGNRFTIADPNDPGMLDVVGFDTAVPEAIAAFARL